MFTRKPTEDIQSLADRTAQSAEQAIRSTQSAANTALDNLSDGVQTLQQDAAGVLEQAARQVEALAHRSSQALQSGSQALLDKAHAASSETRHYIEREPVKSVMIAAATGAALMGLLVLLSRSNDRR